MCHNRHLINTLAFILLTIMVVNFTGCAQETTDILNDAAKEGVDEKYWRYFDREVYFPIGVSVSPEQALAQEIIKESLSDLAASTDLGLDYFIFYEAEDSLLQPVLEDSRYVGRQWTSFIQTWTDTLFSELAVSINASTKDPDIIAAKNALNEREFYIVFRADCFTSSESCNFPTQKQSQLMVWRAIGYMMNMKSGDEAGNQIMKTGHHTDQEADAERSKFIAEFNGALELFRNDLPSPNQQKEDITEVPEDIDSLEQINDKLSEFDQDPTTEDLDKILSEEENPDSVQNTTETNTNSDSSDPIDIDTLFDF